MCVLDEKQTTLGKQENDSGDRTSPVIVRAAYRCGGDRRAVDDQAAVLVYLFALIPRRLGVKIQTATVARIPKSGSSDNRLDWRARQGQIVRLQARALR